MLTLLHHAAVLGQVAVEHAHHEVVPAGPFGRRGKLADGLGCTAPVEVVEVDDVLVFGPLT